MDKTIQTQIENIRSKDPDLQNKAFTYILGVTDKPVNWAYEVWDEMREGLTHKDNHAEQSPHRYSATLPRATQRTECSKISTNCSP